MNKRTVLSYTIRLQKEKKKSKHPGYDTYQELLGGAPTGERRLNCGRGEEESPLHSGWGLGTKSGIRRLTQQKGGQSQTGEVADPTERPRKKGKFLNGKTVFCKGKGEKKKKKAPELLGFLSPP